MYSYTCVQKRGIIRHKKTCNTPHRVDRGNENEKKKMFKKPSFPELAIYINPLISGISALHNIMLCIKKLIPIVGILY